MRNSFVMLIIVSLGQIAVRILGAKTKIGAGNFNEIVVRLRDSQTPGQSVRQRERQSRLPARNSLIPLAASRELCGARNELLSVIMLNFWLLVFFATATFYFYLQITIPLSLSPSPSPSCSLEAFRGCCCFGLCIKLFGSCCCFVCSLKLNNERPFGFMTFR